MQETQVQSLGREEPLEKEMATCSSILAWKIPWTEVVDYFHGGLQPMGLQRFGQDLVTKQQWQLILQLRIQRLREIRQIDKGHHYHCHAGKQTTDCLGPALLGFLTIRFFLWRSITDLSGVQSLGHLGFPGSHCHRFLIISLTSVCNIKPHVCL